MTFTYDYKQFQNAVAPFRSCGMFRKLTCTTTELQFMVHKTIIIHNVIFQLVKHWSIACYFKNL
jgi:hypothetical protein